MFDYEISNLAIRKWHAHLPVVKVKVRGIFEGVQGHGMENIDGIIGWDVFWACKLAYNVDRSAVYLKSN